MNGSELLNQINFKHFYFKGKRFDKKMIENAISHLAKYLTQKNHSTSPFILLTAYNHIKTVIAYYAILKTGKIVVIIDPASKSVELSEIIDDTDAAAMIFLNTNNLAFHYEEEILFRKTKKNQLINSDLNEVCTMAYTNAEDGFSKGAMLTEKNLLSEVKALIKTNNIDPTSVTCALLPFSHLFGFIQGILVPVYAGATGLIIEPNILKITGIIKEIKEYSVTHLYSVPSFYYILSKVPDIKNIIKGIKEFYSGGTQLSPIIFENFYQKTNKKIREGYGLTESSPGVSLNYDEEPIMKSIGKPLPGCEIKIFDENEIECPTGTIGEICIKGDMVFKGYFNYEDTTKMVLKNEWLHSGDYGKKDSKGNIFYCGLKKDMINVGGVNVYPKKVERLMKTNINVSEVKIFCEDSFVQGQSVNAIIKLNDSSEKAQEDFKKWCFQSINNTILPKLWLFE